jgi:integrase/recombinase XerD
MKMYKPHTKDIPGASKGSLLQLLEEYKLSLQALNRSPKTISWYSEILRSYFDFLELNSMLKPVGDMGNHELKAYILHLQKASKWAKSPNIKEDKGELSPHSVQGHVRALKAFWGWLERESYVEHNSLAKFPLPKVPDEPVKTLTIEQIKSLLAQIDRNVAKGAMYYVVLVLLLDTGLRISELINIKLADMDLMQGFVQVMGKGQKVRTVPFSKLTRKELLHYVNSFRSQLCPADSPYLFATPEGNHISVNSVQQFLRRLAKKTGLNGIRVSPHSFRHTFATMAVAGGANVFTLKDIMGHRSLQTTMGYIKQQPEEIQLQHAAFSPVAKLFGSKSNK